MMEDLWYTVSRIIWNYGAGDVQSIHFTTTDSGYVLTHKQYGEGKYKFRLLDGERKVRCCGHTLVLQSPL